MLSELEILRDAGTRLERAGVEFMLTGSVAMSHYATPRMTRDIDLVIQVESASPASLYAAFHPDYYISQDDVLRALESEGMFNILHLASVIKLDLVVRKSSEYRRLEFERRRRVDLGGVEIWIVSKEDLILSKLVWAKESGSELQRRDVRALLDTGADDEYLRKWAAPLGVLAMLEETRR